MPYTYKQLQELIIERRRLHQRSDAPESSSRELVRTCEDLAAKLCAFASDGIVVKHLIEFALPAKKRKDAVEVTAAASGSRSNNQSDATEHTGACAHEQADDQRKTISAATEHAAKPKKKLKKMMMAAML